MFVEALLDVLLTPAPQPAENFNLSRNIGNGRKAPDKTSSPYAKRLGMIALVLVIACIARDSIAQTAKESIDVPPHSRLVLRVVASGDQVQRRLWLRSANPDRGADANADDSRHPSPGGT